MSSAVDTQITKEAKLKDTCFPQFSRGYGSVMSVFCNGGAATPTTAPSHLLQLIQGNTEAFLPEPIGIISPVCPGTYFQCDMPGTPHLGGGQVMR